MILLWFALLCARLTQAQCEQPGGACANTSDCCTNQTFSSECNATTLLCQATPCGVCPCQGYPCTNNSDCCDAQEFGYGNGSYCTSGFSDCQPCIAPGGDCGLDEDCRCLSPNYRCLPGPGFSFICTFVPTAAPTLAPIPCNTTADCPPNSFCDPSESGYYCSSCSDVEGPICCNVSAQCASNEYCSPEFLICVPCALLNESCTSDAQCACAGNLVCTNGTCVPGSSNDNTVVIVTSTIAAVAVLVAAIVCLCCWWWSLPPACHCHRRRHHHKHPGRPHHHARDGRPFYPLR